MAKRRQKPSLTPADPDQDLLSNIVGLLDAARRSTTRSINAAMTATYWEIGRILVDQEQQGDSRGSWGLSLTKRLPISLDGRKRVRPNLVIEVIDSGPDSKAMSLDEQALSRMRVLREIEIEEVWLVQDWSVTICANQQNRRWRRSSQSKFFSGVSSTILSKNLARARRCGENDAIWHLLYDVHPANC